MTKRLLDVIGAGIALIIFAPFALIVGLGLWIMLGWPVLFIHPRAGLHGQVFQLVKFRTMREAFDAQGRPLPDEQRLTRFGAFLRATSLDELPELWNVLKGDMSLVGPRPLLVDYLPLYSPEQARRHDVRPGITGWAQVNGRNAISWNEKLRHDVWYVDHRSLVLDLKILALTLVKVVRAENIRQEGYATMEPFRGANGGFDEHTVDLGTTDPLRPRQTGSRLPSSPTDVRASTESFRTIGRERNGAAS